MATAAKKPSRKTAPLLETVYQSDAKVDREAGIIRDVKILGRNSRNLGGQREYSDQALEDAARMYEGIEVNIDHPDKRTPEIERGLTEGFGFLNGVHRKADGDVYGNLNYLKSHPLTEMFLERVDRMPQNVGLSHNADGITVRRGNKYIVESMATVRSVDIVRNPATNKGLFESEDHTVKKTFREIVEAHKPGSSALFEDAMGPAVMDAPMDAPAEGSSDDQIKAAFRNAVMAAFDDDSLDTPATLKKIKDIMTAYDKLTAKSDTMDSGAALPESLQELAKNPALKVLIEEVRGLRSSVGEITVERDSLRSEKAVKQLIESAGREATEEQINALVKLSPADQKPLLATLPKRAAAGAKPYRGPVLESSDSNRFHDDPKEFAAAVR